MEYRNINRLLQKGRICSVIDDKTEKMKRLNLIQAATTENVNFMVTKGFVCL